MTILPDNGIDFLSYPAAKILSASSGNLRRCFLRIVAACFFAGSLGLLPAAVKTWDGGAGTLNWADANNWNPNGAPTSSDVVWLDNSSTNPLPQINAQSGANAATLFVGGVVSGNLLNYAGSTPLVLNLYGANVNPSNTGPLIYIGTNAESAVSVNKVNFRLQTSGALHVEAGKTLTFNNCILSQNGVRVLTKSGAGTVNFAGSGSEVQFTGGFIITEGTWDAGTDTLDLPATGIITFSNAPGVAATITSANSHTVGGLTGGNTSSEIYVTGASGLTISGSAVTTFSGRIRGATKLTCAGTGKLTLNANSSYTGATVISNGILALGTSGSLSLTPSISIASGGTFDVSALALGFTLTSGRTLAGSGTVAGKLTVASNAVVSPGIGGIGTLTVTNDFTLAVGGHIALDLNSATNYDAIIVTGGNVMLAGDLAGTTFGYTPAIGDTFYIVRNNGTGSTIGTLNGVSDGGKLDIGGKWFRISFTSDFGGAGFQTNGAGNDVALRRINDLSPSGLSVVVVGVTNTASVQLKLSWLDNAAGGSGYRVYRVFDDGSYQLLATLPAGATNFTETTANYAAYTYGVEAFDATGRIGDITLSTPFQAGTSFSGRANTMLDWLAADVPNLGQLGAGPHRVGRVGFWDASARMLRGDTATGISYVTAAVEDASAENSNAGFSMWPGMDAYLRWSNLFPPSLTNRYREVYTTSDLYDNGATPNQKFMLATASYLANSVWGAAVNSVSSATYGTGDASGKSWITSVLNRTPFRGFEEHDATHYLQYTIAPMETLAAYAPDADVRNKARMVVNWGVVEAAGYWHNGHWCAPATRGGTIGAQNSYDITPWTWHVCFGSPPPDANNYFDSFATLPFLSPQFPGLIPEVARAGSDRTQSYTRRTFAQRSAGPELGYFKQSWVTAKYALWSQVEGTVSGFNADGSIILANVNTTAIQDGYQGQRTGLAWDSPPGNDAAIEIKTPTTYSGTTGGISIYEDTLQHEDTLILVHNIPASGGTGGNNGDWPNQWLNGHIPSGWLAITDEATNTGRIFIHYDAVMVAVYLSRPFSWTTDFTVSPWSKGAVAIETAPVDEYPQSTASARLAAFRAAVLGNTPDISALSNAAPRFIYTNRHGNVLDLTYGLAGKIDGLTVDYLQWPMMEDPWMYQAQQGHLHLFGRDRTVVANYYDWTQTTNWHPDVSNLAPLAVSNGTVSVDLAARVTDQETPGTNFAFTISTATNGSVTLLDDMHTARFTPASNFTGAASFAFTARDCGLHPQLVWHYDFESSATLVSNTLRDATGAHRDATLTNVGNGTAAFDPNTPAACGPNSTRSLRLHESGTNAARLTRVVTPANLSMTNGSWTFATWFKRATRTNEDFIFYMGSGDGFGGNGDEVHLHQSANSDNLRLVHYNTTNAADVSLTSVATAPSNQWHHAAVTFEKTADNTGTVRLYLNGALAGTKTNVAWALRQDLPIVLGGHASTSASVVSRYLNGWLYDTALFRGALSSNEVASLAAQSIATFGGTCVTGTVAMSVTAPATPVPVTIINSGAVWKYFDLTNDLVTAWRSNNFNDATWSSGPAMLGFGDANGLFPDTVIASNRQWTTYFRRTFYVPSANQIQSLDGRILRDDGAVVYLNGTEIWRDTNMPSGLISNATPALSALDGTNESTWLPLNLPPSTLNLLVNGTNLLAVEVHQNALNSPDLAMNFELKAMAIVRTNTPLTLMRNAGSLTLTWPADAGPLSLYTATNLMSSVLWMRAISEPILSNGNWLLPIAPFTNQQRFYRLQTP